MTRLPFSGIFQYKFLPTHGLADIPRRVGVRHHGMAAVAEIGIDTDLLADLSNEVLKIWA